MNALRSAFAFLIFLSSFVAASTAVAQPAQAQNSKGSLTVPVTGTSAAGAVTGTFKIERFVTATNDVGQEVLRAVGLLTITDAGGVTRIGKNVAMDVTQPAPRAAAVQQQQAGVCEILNLVLGPLHLDLLGLVVDLNQVILNITAVAGAGNLLGNLLCAIVGLLDGTSSGTLAQLANLLNQLLAILG